MSTNTTNDGDQIKFNQFKNKIQQLGMEELKQLQTTVAEELEQRDSKTDIEDAESLPLVNARWVKWSELSAHPNLKAVRPWILHVTDTHDTFGVDGEWLKKQRIDETYHMDVSGLESGDIIKVSGASHNNRHHTYYRVLTTTDDRLYYEKEILKESEVMEEVG